MAALTSQKVRASFEQVLHVDRDGGGNTTTLVSVKDGDNGTTFALQLATDHIALVDGAYMQADNVRARDGDGLALQDDGGNGPFVNDGGYFTNSVQPCFLVKPAANQENMAAVGAGVTVAFGTEITDQGGDFAANVFTAPVDGNYPLTLLIRLAQIDVDATELAIGFITSNRTYQFTVTPDTLLAADDYMSFSFSVIADMDAADTAYVQIAITGGAAQTDVEAGFTYFSGGLFC